MNHFDISHINPRLFALIHTNPRVYAITQEDSWSSYWTNTNRTEVLFFGEISKIRDGKLYNQKSGATDYLTVGGVAGSYTFQCPNTAAYIAADAENDIDYLWFDTLGAQRTVTTAELIGYDFTRTIIKYDNTTPYQIRAIMILASGEVLTTAVENRMRDDFDLSIWWSDVLSFHGNVKGNRGIGQSKWPSTYFITTWDTENAGSATKTIVIPTFGAGYDFYINWGDGSALEHQTGTPGDITHVYSTTGIKTIKISGTFPRIYFNNSGDKLKILTIANWGNIAWGSMVNAFYGCSNLTGTYTDVPNTAAVTGMTNMFYGCAAFNSPVAFSTANVTAMTGMFYGCTLFNQSLASFNTAKVTLMNTMFRNAVAFNQSLANFDTALVTSMASMFYGATNFNQPLPFNTVKVTDMSAMIRTCTSFDQDLSGFDVHLVTTMANMLNGSNALSTANYDLLLISWGAQVVQNTVSFHAGDAKYTDGGAAAAARAHLVLAVGSGGHGWTITDGGIA